MRERTEEIVSVGARAGLRRRARVRRWAARALLLVPGAAVVALDVAWRWRQIAEYSPEALEAYQARAALALVLWGALVAAAARRRGAGRGAALALLALLATFALGTQFYTAARYGTYVSWRVALMGTSLWPAFGRHAVAALAYGVPVALALVAPRVARRVAPTRKWSARAALAASAAALGVAAVWGSPDAGWDNGAPPDMLYLGAVGTLARSKMTGDDVMTKLPNLPAARSPQPLPRLVPARARDVVFVVTESVRATDACSTYDPGCETTPDTNALAPRRFGLRQMRAVDSTTSISLAVLMSGLSPADSRRALLSAPLLWEYARAAGYETAYFTSQNLLFANSGRWLDDVPLTRELSATEYEPYATYQCGADDATLVTKAIDALATMREPFFGVVHLSNTHFPYCAFEDATSAPLDEGDRASLLARYHAAIRRQDRHVARLLEAVRRARSGPRTVVVFVSDHGEQLRERGQVGHTWSLYDEEIRVPFWIDAPPGTLTTEERAALRALEATPVTTLDVAPTILDLLGVDGAAGAAKARARMPGRSLLRGGSPKEQAVVMTNCSPLVSCATKNWGAMRGTQKLIATEDEPGPWRCFDVARDPYEESPEPAEACGDLRALAEGSGRGTPFPAP